MIWIIQLVTDNVSLDQIIMKALIEDRLANLPVDIRTISNYEASCSYGPFHTFFIYTGGSAKGVGHISHGKSQVILSKFP